MAKDLNTLIEVLLKIQDFDMQMIQLMNVKQTRQDELKRSQQKLGDLQQKKTLKEAEITEIKKIITLIESEVSGIKEAVKRLESQQNQVKKVEEFNALNQEVSTKEKERVLKEKKLSELYDQLAAEEDSLGSILERLSLNSETNSMLAKEIRETIAEINKEGKAIEEQRNALVPQVDPEAFAIYERLLRNRKDRVLVSIEDRCCNGCHITVTAQHENLVRRGERFIFCEHCSRLHYWQETAHVEADEASGARQRRRRKVV